MADRGYALATDATGNIYVTGYTRGNLAATNLGDKDVYVAKLDPNGTQLWVQQFGSAGEDKGWGVAATGDGIRRRRHDVGRDGHARRRARRLGGALRRRREPRLAAAVRHGRATRRSGG